MKYVWSAVIIVAAIVALTTRSAADPPADTAPSPSAVSALMQMKLEASKAILEGLTLEDYTAVEQQAKKLKLLSMESGWNVIQTDEYADQSRDFRRTTDLIARAAESKDVGRATLGYVSLTVRCVECHTYMRSHRQQSRNPNSR
jgi:hypothetical protein